MSDLVKFLLDQKKINGIILKNKFKLFALLYFINIIVMFLSQVLFIELEKLELINKINNSKKIYYSGFNLILISGLLVPFTEEIINRLWLKFNKYYFPVSFSVFFFLFSFVFIYGNDIDHIFLIRTDLFKSLFLSIIIFFMLKLVISKNLKKMIFIYEEHSLKLFYISALIFSMLHLSNYNFDAENSIYFIPLFLFPYFIAGILLGYIRLKLGFFYVVLFHALHNLLFICLKLILTK